MVKMKDSGIEWIGEIPETWEKVKFNAIYSNRNTKVSDREYAPLSVTKKGIVPQLATAAKTNDNDNRKLVKSGDFVINSRSDRRGSCGISSLDGSVSLINTVLEPKNSQMEPLYFDFLFHTIQFADEFYKWGHGIVDDLWTTNWNDMKNITLILPTRFEQQLIADFLDHKTAEIDGLIDKINTEIDTLKQYQSSVITQAVTKGLDPNVPMKDSGIEWIGEIPEAWRTIAIKYTSWLKGRIGWQGLTSDEYINDGPYLITGTDFKNGMINWESCVHISEERFEQDADIHIQEGDLLITKDGTVGKVALVQNIPGKVSINSGILLIRNTKINYDNKFLYYTLLSEEFKVWFYNTKPENSTILHLYQNQFYNFKFAFPTIDEQKKIIDYLDQKVAKIQKIIKSKQQQINQLTEYKNSLIFEYVTGKKQVKEAN